MKLTQTVSSHARCGWALGEICTFSKSYFFCIFEASGIRFMHEFRGLTHYSCHLDNLWMRRGKGGLIDDIHGDMELDRGWVCTPIRDPLLVKMTPPFFHKSVQHWWITQRYFGAVLADHSFGEIHKRMHRRTHKHTHAPTHSHTHKHTDKHTHKQARTRTHARTHFCQLKQNLWGWKLIRTELADHSFRENCF